MRRWDSFREHFSLATCKLYKLAFEYEIHQCSLPFWQLFIRSFGCGAFFPVYFRDPEESLEHGFVYELAHFIYGAADWRHISLVDRDIQVGHTSRDNKVPLSSAPTFYLRWHLPALSTDTPPISVILGTASAGASGASVALASISISRSSSWGILVQNGMLDHQTQNLVRVSSSRSHLS